MYDVSGFLSGIQHMVVTFLIFLTALALGRVILQGILCSMGVLDWAASIISASLVFMIGFAVIMHFLYQPGMGLPIGYISDAVNQSIQSFDTLARVL